MTKLRSFFGWIFLLMLIPIFVFTLMASGREAQNMKPLDQVLDEKINIKDIGLVQNSYMYDRDGALISEIVSDHQNRVFVPYKDIPEHVKQLFLTSEDRHFFQHKGFDFIGMARAAAANVKKGGIDQGASTITQQLSRNLYLNHERTFDRKFTELLYSYQ
ncbi:transglycosylase domain-containing protein, partial [Bacillus licheniformis]